MDYGLVPHGVVRTNDSRAEKNKICGRDILVLNLLIFPLFINIGHFDPGKI